MGQRTRWERNPNKKRIQMEHPSRSAESPPGGEITVPLFRQGVDEHGGTRTPDTQNRNLMLYPTELHAQFRPAPEG